jgi:hypothetical protein
VCDPVRRHREVEANVGEWNDKEPLFGAAPASSLRLFREARTALPTGRIHRRQCLVLPDKAAARATHCCARFLLATGTSVRVRPLPHPRSITMTSSSIPHHRTPPSDSVPEFLPTSGRRHLHGQKCARGQLRRSPLPLPGFPACRRFLKRCSVLHHESGDISRFLPVHLRRPIPSPPKQFPITRESGSL